VLSILHKRMWLADLGWMFVSKGSQLLERSPVDLALTRPTNRSLSRLT